mgnify:FL=1
MKKYYRLLTYVAVLVICLLVAGAVYHDQASRARERPQYIKVLEPQTQEVDNAQMEREKWEGRQ